MFRQKWFVFACIFTVMLAVVPVAFAALEGLTLNPTATISSGKAMLTVSGTVTCPVGESLLGLYVRAFQQRGSRQTAGSANLMPYDWYYPELGEPWDCTGGPMPWAVTIRPSEGIDGLWQPGPVSVVVNADGCKYVPDEYGYGMTCESGTQGNLRIDARLHASQ